MRQVWTIIVGAWIFIVPYLYHVFIFREAWFPIRGWAVLNLVALIWLTVRQVRIDRATERPSG